nr:homeobox protein NANOG [Cavia porcellus]
MSVAPDCPPSLSCSEAAGSGDPSPTPEVPRPAETCGALQPPEAEQPLAESAPGLRRRLSPPGGWKRRAGARVAETPDSSIPCATLPSSLEALGRKEEGKVAGRKLKPYTVLSKMQLCVLRDRFQRQQYLNLQHIQELSSLLNLSCKQKVPAPAEYPGVCSNYAQSCLVNTSGNLPMWGNQTWNNSAWSSQTWGSQSWGNHSWNTETWNTQSWCPQAWNSPFPSFGEESLQPCLPFPQNFPTSNLEAMLEAVGDSQEYCTTPRPWIFS